jgi:hypothetical protein
MNVAAVVIQFCHQIVTMLCNVHHDVVDAFIGRKNQRWPRPREAQPAAQQGQAADLELEKD